MVQGCNVYLKKIKFGIKQQNYPSGHPGYINELYHRTILNTCGDPHTGQGNGAYYNRLLYH